MAKRSNATPAVFLMPYGVRVAARGLITLIGTSPNISSAGCREGNDRPRSPCSSMPGRAGADRGRLIFLRFGFGCCRAIGARCRRWARRPRRQDYVPESVIPRLAGDRETVADFARGTTMTSHHRHPARRHPQHAVSGHDAQADDVLILAGAPEHLERVIATDGSNVKGRIAARPKVRHRHRVIEAVIGPIRRCAGTPRGGWAAQPFGVNLIAVSRQGERLASGWGRSSCRPATSSCSGAIALLFERMNRSRLPAARGTHTARGSARKGLLPLAILEWR